MLMHNPLHPGLIVKDALIDNTGLTVTDAANRLGVTRTTLSRLINGKAGLSPEMALRLSQFFGNNVEMWMNLQAQYDVWQIKRPINKKRVHIARFHKAA
ncbi:MAG: HigA family addiction module antitoxin [Pseudomonadota bacterium]|nr:HigA family addiction module antitoxin [Pseudomonadota bacterium]